MDSHAAVLTDVRRTYGRGQSMVHALRGVSINFPAHSWTAIMGPSGSGKSTLLHCAAGLERVTDGRIELAGADITRAPERDLTRMRRTTVGFVFQSFNLMAALTAEQNVVLPFRLAGQKVPRARVREVLSKVGLADRLRHRPRQLSGGEQQRVALARALVTEPQVLFADEPTGALDSQTARTVLELLRSMVDGGQTVAMVTHDPVTASYADTVIFLSDGQVHSTAYRPSRELIAHRLTELGA